MKRNKKRVRIYKGIWIKAVSCLLAMLFILSGCSVFDGGKAEVKVDFGEYGDMGTAGAGSETPGTTEEGAQGSEGSTAAGAPEESGEPGASPSAEEKPNEGWPGKDDTPGGSQADETVTETTEGTAAETGAAGQLQAPEGSRETFMKSAFAKELLAYLEAEGRGEEAFSEPIFDTEKKVYSKQELEELSDVMCRIFRNEIYARHGMIFGNEDLNRLYSAFSWYEGTIGLRDFEAQAELPFNETEYANIANVVAVEKARREGGAN